MGNRVYYLLSPVRGVNEKLCLEKGRFLGKTRGRSGVTLIAAWLAGKKRRAAQKVPVVDKSLARIGGPPEGGRARAEEIG